MSESLAQERQAAAAPRVNLRELVVESALRATTALLFAGFVYGAIQHWLAAPSRISLLLLVLANCLTLGLTLFARVPKKRDWNPITVLCSLGGTYYFLAIELAPGAHLAPEVVGAGLQVIGIAWQIYAKLSLRFSFGILPANRGIVSSGAYRFMRHPIYLSYLVADVGFLLTNFGLQNLLVYAGLYTLQLMRIHREEALLSNDPEYRLYREKVRFRVLPGIY